MAGPRPNENLLWPEPQGYDRATYLPIGKAAGGRAELAWPGMIRDTLNDLNSLVTAPGKAYQGRLSPEDLAALPSKVSQLQLFDTPAGLASAGAEEAGEQTIQHNIFAGIRAKMANMPKLTQALTMEGRGEQAQDIWNSTGWFRGPEGKWRFEIPDQEAMLHGQNITGGNLDIGRSQVMPLDDVLHHPDLYNAYPQLKNTRVSGVIGAPGSGLYRPDDNEINIANGPKGEALSTMLHEGQHAVQDVEGFAEGGSPAQFLTPQHYNNQALLQHHWDQLSTAANAAGVDPKNVMTGMQRFAQGRPLGAAASDVTALGKANPDLLEAFRQHYNNSVVLQNQQKAATESYNNLAGEVEARNVQERHEQGYGPETPPWQTPGYTPVSQQIVVTGDHGPASLTPVSHDPFQQALIPVEHNPWTTTVEPVQHDPFATLEGTSPP